MTCVKSVKKNTLKNSHNMNSLLPTQSKRPLSYYEWLIREVNKEDTAEVEMPEIPEYKKVKIKWSEVSKVAFAWGIGMFSI
jgi:hypothetical protein